MADKESCQRDLLCPLCKVPKPCIGHLTEHLKKFHKPLTELGPCSKRDDRLRLSSKQKEELTKAVPENRYKSTKYKYSLIQNIVAPESFPIPVDKFFLPSDEEHVKPPVPVPQSWNLQEYFHGHTETTLNMFLALEENEKGAVIQHFEELVHTLRVTAANEKGTTTSQPALAHPFPILDPPGPTFKRQPLEWPGDVLLDPRFLEQETESHEDDRGHPTRADEGLSLGLDGALAVTAVSARNLKFQ